MNTQDKKIKKLLDTISKKRETLGTKPRALYRGNGKVKEKNLNVLTLEEVVEIYGSIATDEASCKSAMEELGVEVSLANMEDAKYDLQLRAEILVWTAEDTKIKALEKQLKELRSEEAKTADALSEIESML